MAPPADSPKRNAAPKQLAKLDLDAERQKSAKLAVNKSEDSPEKHKKATITTKKTKHQPPASSTKGTAATTTANNSSKPVAKAKNNSPVYSKQGKVAIATEDQFQDLADTTAPKPQPATHAHKPRPASAAGGGAGGAAKPAAKARPTSASPSGTAASAAAAKRSGGSSRKLPTAAAAGGPVVVAVKPAFQDHEQEQEQDQDLAEKLLDEKELPAKGLYDIFVQTRKCEKLCYELGLRLKHIRQIKKRFDDNDMYHTGEITQAEFFFMINEDRRPLTKGILQYGNVTHDQKFLSFDQYLLCVVTFASLTPPEVYQFAFDLYDDDQSGTLDEHEFAKMSKELQSNQFSFPKNVEAAIRVIEGDRAGHVTDDGLVDLNEFMKFAKISPLAFHPLFNFQKNVRKATLGENKWSNVVARKLKIRELVSHMRHNYGSIPDLSFGERLWSLVDGEVMEIRKRASQIYSIELNHRRVEEGDENTVDGEDHH